MARKARNQSNQESGSTGDQATRGRLPAPRPQPTVIYPPNETPSLLDDLPALVLGLTAAVLPRLVEPGIRDLYQLPKSFAMSVGAAWMLAAVAALALLGRPVGMPRTPLRWPLLGLAGSVAIAIAIAPDETGGVLSIFAKMDAMRWGAALLVTVLTIATVRTPRQLLYVVGGMLLGGLQVAHFGIAQHHNIDGWLPADARRWVDINAPGSTFGNRNMAAQLIVAVMPGAYVLLAMALRWWRQDRLQLALGVGISANFLLFMLIYYLRLSVTRSAWGGAALGLLVAVALYGVGLLQRRQRDAAAGAPDEAPAPAPKRSAGPLLVGLGASGLAAILLANALLIDAGFSARYDEGVGDKKRRMSITELVSTIGDTEDAHWAMRRMMWASTWEAIVANPLGGGAGNWRVLFPQYVTQRENNDHFSIAKQPTRAHNDFLQLWSEFGIQGFLSFLAMIGMAFYLSMHTLAMARRPKLLARDDVAWMTLASLSSVAGLVAICGDALLSFPFQLPAPTFFFMVHIGVIGAAAVFVERARTAHYPPALPAVPTPLPRLQGGAVPALVAAAIATVAFVHWENARLLEAEKGFTFARAKQKRGQAAAALVDIGVATKINGDDFQNHFIEGLCHNSLGDMPKAIAAIERSLALYPNLLNAWVNLAMFAQKAGDDQKMHFALDSALALKPDEVYALNTRARWFNSRGRYDDTIASLEGFLEVHKSNEPYLDNLAEAYERKGRWKELAAVRRHMVANITAARIDDGSPGGRQRRAEDSERVRKARLEGWVNVARALERAGDHAGSAEALGHAARLAQRSRGDIKRDYAIALAKAGDLEGAYRETGVAMDVDPSQEGALLAALGALKLEATSDESKTAIERVLTRVQKMAKAAKSR